MRLRDVPYWLADRDCQTATHLLDHDVILDWTTTQRDTAPFDDSITFQMVPLYMKVGPHAFPPVIMAPAEMVGFDGYSNGLRQLSGAHRLRAAYFAGLEQIPAYLVQEHANPPAGRVSIFDVPRIDRSAIMSRAERISELQPLYTVSEALYRAAFDYEQGRMGAIPIEANRLVQAVINDPASLMKVST